MRHPPGHRSCPGAGAQPEPGSGEVDDAGVDLVEEGATAMASRDQEAGQGEAAAAEEERVERPGGRGNGVQGGPPVKRRFAGSSIT